MSADTPGNSFYFNIIIIIVIIIIIIIISQLHKVEYK